MVVSGKRKIHPNLVFSDEMYIFIAQPFAQNHPLKIFHERNRSQITIYGTITIFIYRLYRLWFMFFFPDVSAIRCI